jgi:hypothetical protein
VSNFIAWLIFFAIVSLILLAIFVQVWNDAKEIGAEQQRRKDFRETNHWKQKAQHQITHIKVLDGEEFILRR